MFYNTENLFDIFDNPDKQDDDFLPEGKYHWTANLYRTKLRNIAKVIALTGEGEIPAVAGLCEVENETVIRDLVKATPLKKAGFRFVVTNSPDRRGINVALLYRNSIFNYLYHQAYSVRFPYKSRKTTRDILHVTGRLPGKDTLDIFVCHFPSRINGQAKTEYDRKHVASLLRQKTDSLSRVRHTCQIIILGDFNDGPADVSIAETLAAIPPVPQPDRRKLYNLFREQDGSAGSHKYRKEWWSPDQIIVSGSLLAGEGTLKVLPHTAAVFSGDFLFVRSRKGAPKQPMRTFKNGSGKIGFSDHLPVYVDCEIRK
jgi:endonuclease/exonuclease/phosphatase family metal-dependent hydrolase